MDSPDRPLTLLHVTTSGNRSGGTRQAWGLVQALRDRGHRVVFAGTEGGWIYDEARRAGFPTVPLSHRGLRAKWASSRLLREVSRREAVDVVHTHHTHGHNLALLATFGGGFPPVVANRGVIFRPEFPLKFRSGRTAAVITNSEAARGVLVSCGVAPAKIHVVYNAKELPDLDEVRSHADALRRELDLFGAGAVVGAVGSGRAEKGFQFLVEAAPAILARHPGTTFVLVGAAADHLWPRIRALGLADRFRLTGARSDVVRVMGLFDVLAFPSVGMDSCPNVVLEAMGVGLPVVGSAVGGVPELVEEGKNGRVVPPGDPGALAAAVGELLARPEEARALGARGREVVGERYSVERKAQATLDVYRRVLAP